MIGMYDVFQLSKSEVSLMGYEWKGLNPKCVVCLIHGIGEHAGRYDRIGEAFKQEGIALVGMDLRGHGLSLGKRGHTAPRKSIFEDIDKLIEFSLNRYPNLPMILYGHSMGGNIALDYRKRGKHRTIPMAYLITSPWIILQRKIPGYLYFITKLLAKLKPDFLLNSNIKSEILGNTDIILKQENPHLKHGKISAKTAVESFEIADALINDTLEILGEEPLRPMLLMHGDADIVCVPEGSQKIAQLEGSLCRYIQWKGLYHEIHNGNATEDGMDVIRTMIHWIQEISRL